MLRKLTINEMQNLAESRGGKCLSKQYINCNINLQWQCIKGHVWKATPNNVKRGTWCPYCANRVKFTIEQMKKIAQHKLGVCLSLKYVNSKTKLRWQCMQGHTWMATPCNIKRGQWCPYCSGNARGDIESMKCLAKERKGKCISNEYVNSGTKLKWQCEKGHIWEARPDVIKRGSWCPICRLHISEKICRSFFEAIFKQRFPKSKPKWLRNSRRNLMELDGYSKKLGIAFEYQGEQHYRYVARWHTKRTFKQQKEDDILKRKMCKSHNIILLEMPYDIKYENMHEYIIKQCAREGITLPKIKPIDYRSFDIYSDKELEELKRFAKEKGGKCLSDTYINSQTKLTWQCKEGHVWKATPNNVKRNYWCPYCAGRHKKIEDMQKLAKSQGGLCLSEEYIKATTKLKWQCAKGHIWEATPHKINHGRWCPFCVGKRKTLENMKELAESKKGKCLSKKYLGVKTKLKWKCSEGHIWNAIPDNILQGKWCPFCAGQRKTIRDMQKLAKSKQGKCLSKEYSGATIKLKWKCKEGHIWENTPSHIQTGQWCPICARKNRKS